MFKPIFKFQIKMGMVPEILLTVAKFYHLWATVSKFSKNHSDFQISKFGV